MALTDKKICSGCGESKGLDSFGERKARGKTYLKSRCIDCERTYQRDWKRARGPVGTEDYRRAKRREQLYGITREDTIDMLLEQDFCCPICTKPMDFSKLCVDHSHETSNVRGILDQNCNSALGKFGDNIATLSRAQVYLEVRL